MEVFIRNVPQHTSTKELRQQLSAPLARCGIRDGEYTVDKMRGKPHGTMLIRDLSCAQAFLATHGIPAYSPSHVRPLTEIVLNGKRLLLTKSRNDPSEFALKALAYESPQQKRATKPSESTTSSAGSTRFAISGLQCGLWDYEQNRLVFTQQYVSTAPRGTVTFGHKEAIVLLETNGAEQMRIDFRYHDLDNVVLGSAQSPTVTLSSRGITPKMYRVNNVDALTAQLNRLLIGPSAVAAGNLKKTRVTDVDGAHAIVAGVCFVYRLTLAVPHQISSVRAVLGRSAQMPATISINTTVQRPAEQYERAKARLENELTDLKLWGNERWSTRFQLSRLATNGVLHPRQVLELLPTVRLCMANHGWQATENALRVLYEQVPFAGPDIEATDLSRGAITEMFEQAALNCESHASGSQYALVKRHAHINLVHRIVVTPVAGGTYLEGPEPEPTNRVLRKYASQADHFLRVVFQDVDGASVRYDSRTSNDVIFHQHFKQVLDTGVLTAGRHFKFLGFSHSSLRSQTCWFMAPLFENGEFKLAPQILKRLGDFEHIRLVIILSTWFDGAYLLTSNSIPAKCAACIGQCFTDTNRTVKIQPHELGYIPDVERSGRVLSDGAGRSA